MFQKLSSDVKFDYQVNEAKIYISNKPVWSSTAILSAENDTNL